MKKQIKEAMEYLTPFLHKKIHIPEWGEDRYIIPLSFDNDGFDYPWSLKYKDWFRIINKINLISLDWNEFKEKENK